MEAAGKASEMTEAPHYKPRGSRDSDAPASLIHVAGEQEQFALPGTLWPAGCDRGEGDPLFFAKITKDQANELLVAFGHPLGPFNRPFGYQAWGLAIEGPGSRRRGVRLNRRRDRRRLQAPPGCRPRPDRTPPGPSGDHAGHAPPVAGLPGATLGLLGRASAGCSLVRTPWQGGDLYRFDGWRKYGDCKPWAGGGNWSKPSKANTMADGIKSLYYYEYPSSASSPSTVRS
jgi:hypothetical protein